MRKIIVAAMSFAIVGIAFGAPLERFFRITDPDGVVEVKTPNSVTFTNAIRNKAYPYGTMVRTGDKNAAATLLLSPEDGVKLSPNTFVETKVNPNGKTLFLHRGTLITRLMEQPHQDALIIDTFCGRCVKMKGNIHVQVKDDSNTESVTLNVRAEGASSAKVIGHQYLIPSLRSNFGASIVSRYDHSLTRIENLLGDYPIFINKGLSEDPSYDEAANDIPDDFLTVNTSVHCALKIWREHSPIGHRLIVSVLATGPDGKGRENFAFAVGLSDIAARSVLVDAEPSAAAADSSADSSAGDAVGAAPAGDDDFPTFGDETAPVAFGDDAAPAADDDNAGGDDDFGDFNFEF